MIPRINTTTYAKYNIRYLGPVIFSKLSMRITSSVTLASFKNQVRKVDNENLPGTGKSVTLRIINGAGQVSKFVYLFV